MKIITIFAMGAGGEIAANSINQVKNYGLPWPRNPEDMTFVNDKLKEFSAGNSAILMTTATWKSLPAPLQNRLVATYKQVIFLGTKDTQLQFSNSSVEKFAKEFKKGIDLVTKDRIDTLVYFGSPRFLSKMVYISDETYVTLISNPTKDIEVRELPPHAMSHLMNKSPKVKISDITNGTIYKVASRIYETV